MTVRKTLATAAAPVLLAAGLLLTAACAGPESTAAEPSEPDPVTAALADVERIEVPRLVEVAGTVEAAQSASISARVMARVTAVRVQPGDAVRQGQRLLDIDPTAAAGQLSQAQGARAQAAAALALAERNYERFKALAAADAASELELDMARMQYEQARGAVEQAEGAVAAASSVAADSLVVAPFAGRVVRRMVDVGDLAAPGRPLLTLEADGQQRLSLAVPESARAAAALALGDRLTARIDSRPDLGAFEAPIVELAPAADPASHTYAVKLGLPAAGVASGAAGRAWIETARRVVVAVPADAILHQGGLALVVLSTAEGRASSRVVVTGETLAGGRVEVLSGLAGGETVAVGLAAAPPTGAPLRRAEGAAS